MDQRISYYIPDVRSKKWYMPIVFHWIEIVLHNSFILFTKVKQYKITYREFCQQIIRSLVSDIRSQKGISASKKRVSINNKKPEPIIIELGNEDCALGYNTKNKCSICLAQNKKKYTSYFCKKHNLPVCVLVCYDIHMKNLHI